MLLLLYFILFVPGEGHEDEDLPKLRGKYGTAQCTVSPSFPNNNFVSTFRSSTAGLPSPQQKLVSGISDSDDLIFVQTCTYQMLRNGATDLVLNLAKSLGKGFKGYSKSRSFA